MRKATRNSRRTKDRPITPIKEAKKYDKLKADEAQRQLIQDKVIKEIPAEVEKSVQNILDIELTKLKKEMSFQSNILNE